MLYVKYRARSHANVMWDYLLSLLPLLFPSVTNRTNSYLFVSTAHLVEKKTTVYIIIHDPPHGYFDHM